MVFGGALSQGRHRLYEEDVGMRFKGRRLLALLMAAALAAGPVGQLALTAQEVEQIETFAEEPGSENELAAAVAEEGGEVSEPAGEGEQPVTEAPAPADPVPVEPEAPAPVETEAPVPVEPEYVPPVETEAPVPAEPEYVPPVETEYVPPVETEPIVIPVIEPETSAPAPETEAPAPVTEAPEPETEAKTEKEKETEKAIRIKEPAKVEKVTELEAKGEDVTITIKLEESDGVSKAALLHVTKLSKRYDENSYNSAMETLRAETDKGHRELSRAAFYQIEIEEAGRVITPAGEVTLTFSYPEGFSTELKDGLDGEAAVYQMGDGAVRIADVALNDQNNVDSFTVSGKGLKLLALAGIQNHVNNGDELKQKKLNMRAM